MNSGITLEVTLKDFCEFVKCYCGTDNNNYYVDSCHTGDTEILAFFISNFTR